MWSLHMLCTCTFSRAVWGLNRTADTTYTTLMRRSRRATANYSQIVWFMHTGDRFVIITQCLQTNAHRRFALKTTQRLCFWKVCYLHEKIALVLSLFYLFVYLSFLSMQSPSTWDASLAVTFHPSEILIRAVMINNTCWTSHYKNTLSTANFLLTNWGSNELVSGLSSGIVERWSEYVIILIDFLESSYLIILIKHI